MSYQVQQISIPEKDSLLQNYKDRFLSTNKADIYGCAGKLLIDLERVKVLWEDNFFSMSENTRSYGRLDVLEEEGTPMTVKY